MPSTAVLEVTAGSAMQPPSPITPLQQPNATPGDVAPTGKAPSPVGWRAISPRTTLYAADSPSSSSSSTSGPPSPPTPLPCAADGGEAARANAAAQQQSEGSAAGTAGGGRAPQPVLDGGLLATCRQLSFLGEVRARHAR